MSAATVTELQTQLQSLLGQIAVLQAQGGASRCPSLSRSLSLRLRGEDVRVLQEFLIAQGLLAGGNDTGYFGSLTQAAVRAYQRSNGIVSSGTPVSTGYGTVGPRTRAAIAARCTSEVSSHPQPQVGAQASNPGGGGGGNQQAASALAAQAPSDLYVAPTGSDANDGTSQSPLRTLQKAADAALPGTTVHVGPGEYPGQVIIRASGTAEKPIVFVSDTRWGARVKTIGVNPSVQTRGDHIVFKNFEVTGDGLIGIENYSAEGVQIIGNYVHDIDPLNRGCTLDGGVGGAGIAVSKEDGRDHVVLANKVARIGEASQPCALSHGIYIMNRHATVANNIVFMAAGWGLSSWHHASELIAVNNLLFNNGAGGILVAAGQVDPSQEHDYAYVANNITMYNNNQNGKWPAGGILETGFTGVHNAYVNNILFNDAGDEISLQNGLTATGTILADPKFVDNKYGGTGDYHLTSDSPAIDAATSYRAPAYDFDGVLRPQSKAIDIGPYEFIE